MIGFPLILVDIFSNVQQEVSLRQSSVIYLKNLINRAWEVEQADVDKITQISEQDKVALRSRIIGLIVDSPEAIRLVHLLIC
jgi:hypothetical protein